MIPWKDLSVKAKAEQNEFSQTTTRNTKKTMERELVVRGRHRESRRDTSESTFIQILRRTN